jgi:hypothetical protein
MAKLRWMNRAGKSSITRAIRFPTVDHLPDIISGIPWNQQVICVRERAPVFL